MIKRIVSFLRYALVFVCFGFCAIGMFLIFSQEIIGWIVIVFFGGIGSFLFYELRRSQPKPAEVSNVVIGKDLKEIQERHDLECKITKKLVKRFVPRVKDGEPVPPWIKFPGPGPFDIGWRMGGGESYLASEFSPFMMKLDQEEREEYFSRYDLGPDWPQRHFWHSAWIDWEEED